MEYKECYFLIPGTSLGEGLRSLPMDADYLKSAKANSGHEEIELFIEHTISEPKIVEQVDDIEAIRIMREKCENGGVQEGNNVVVIDVEVHVKEVLFKLVDGVDWE